MMVTLNETHSPDAKSWVATANQGSDFPLQNLPFGVFRRAGSSERFRCGVAIGDQVLDLSATISTGVFSGEALVAVQTCANDSLNALMALGQSHWSKLRLALFRALKEGSPARSALAGCLVPQAQIEMSMPARVGDYTDFYTSIYHATNVGKLFRPDNPLLPNYKWVPIGYHGRASSIGVSGQTIRRPTGQTMPPGAERPSFGPTKRLDYELELGIFVGAGNPIGQPIAMSDAESHVFGLCLLNDWSARDLQAWEYQPLGPFLAKNFATTISPWIVTLEALAPFRSAFTRPAEDPQPLPYLDSETNRSHGALDVQLEVLIETPAARAATITANAAAHRLCQTSYRHAYWTMAQLITHHTVNGCNLQPGDLLGSGTLSGPTASEAGALLELTQGGKQPVDVGVVDGKTQTRTFVEDGDAIIMRAWCEREGAVRIGFGECRGQVVAR
jgi:fumarylacetoacetase